MSTTSRSEKHNRSKTAVGCMSGLFHFLSRHHNHSRKRLTSANKKKEKTLIIHSTPLPPHPLKLHPSQPSPPPSTNGVQCYVAPRSPTIQADIRREPSTCSASISANVDSPRRPPALVARLMGLEESLDSSETTSQPESASEKRRKLLGALEKCDEDLKALKRIIEAVRLAEIKTKAVVSAVGSDKNVTAGLVCNGRADRFELDGRDSKIECNGDQPSPVSVLDAISSPRYRSKRNDTDKESGYKIVKPSRMNVVFTGEQGKKLDSDNNNYTNRRIVTEVLARPIYELKEFDKRVPSRGQKIVSKGRLSGALVASVSEVCEDGMWEERWEFGRVMLGLEVDIYYDLVEEFALDLLEYCYQFYFRVRTSRKRLCF